MFCSRAKSQIGGCIRDFTPKLHVILCLYYVYHKMVKCKSKCYIIEAKKKKKSVISS